MGNKGRQKPPGLVGVGYGIGAVYGHRIKFEFGISAARRNATTGWAFASRGCVLRWEIAPWPRHTRPRYGQ